MQGHVLVRGPESRSFVPPPQQHAVWQPYYGQMQAQPTQLQLQPPPSQATLQPPPTHAQLPSQVQVQPPPAQVQEQPHPDPMSATLQALPTTYGGHAQLQHLQTVPATPQRGLQQCSMQFQQTAGASRKQVPVSVEVVLGSSAGPQQPPRGFVNYAPPYCPNRVPTAANVEHLDPLMVFSLMKEGRCLLVDVRGEDRASGLIEGSLHVPAVGPGNILGRLPELAQQWANQPLVAFTCQYSAHRAPQCANWYRQHAPPHQRVAILSGGFRGWESVGLPVQSLADSESAQAADELAMQLGAQFVQGLRAQTQVGAQGTVMPAGAVAQAQQLQQAVASTSAVVPQSGRQPYVPPACPNRVPTVAGIEHIEPTVVYSLMKEKKCLLVDLRGDDRSSGLIEGAVHVRAIDNVPFCVKVPDLVRQWADQNLVIFTCQYSAHRAPQCANWYRQEASPLQHVGILSGGFRGWEACGLPVQSLASGEAAKAADEMAMRMGTQFVQTASVQDFQAQASHQLDGHGALLQQQPPQPPQLPQQEMSAPMQMQAQEPLAQQFQQALPQYHLPAQQTLLQAAPQAAPQAQAAPAAPAPAQQVAEPAAHAPARGAYVPPHLPNTVPTIKDVEHIEPLRVNELLKAGQCLLVDLRGEDRSSGLIEGALHEPAIDSVPFTTKVAKLVHRWADQSLVIFTCQYSAHRAPQCANWYREKADPRQRVAILSGGFRGWEANGLPVRSPAAGDDAKAADEVAVKLGTKFVEGCLAGVPGGGFCLPPGGKAKEAAPAAAEPKAAQPRAAAPPQQLAQKPYVPPQLPNTVPLIENIENIDPRIVHELLQSRSCLLVDLRGEDRAAGLIDGAIHEPAIDTVPFPVKVPNLVRQWADQPLVVFTCQYSAHRAPQCANWYRRGTDPRQRVAVLSGGFRGWEALGLPVKAPGTAEQGHAADETAKQLGIQFAGGCVVRVPGGGFSIPAA